jgi:hypothetical protein
LLTEHRIATQAQWQAERDELLKAEKELTRRGDELARKRRELPWVPVETEYTFQTADGSKSLAELFDGRSQLGHRLGSSGGTDFNRDLGFLSTEEERKPFLEGEIPLTVEQDARMCGTDALGYVSEGPGLSVSRDGTGPSTGPTSRPPAGSR